MHGRMRQQDGDGESEAVAYCDRPGAGLYGCAISEDERHYDAMSFYSVIRQRRSIRGYKSDPVPPEVLDRVLEAGRTAPTAANFQPFHLIVVTDPATRARMNTVYDRDWFCGAPVVLVGCVDPSKAWQRADGWNAAEFDLAIVVDHIILAATEEGLGTCWICNFREQPLKELLRIPAHIRAVALTPLGYPSLSPGPFARKAMSELVHREKW